MHRRIAVFSLISCFSVITQVRPAQASIIVGAPGDPGVGDCLPFGCIPNGSTNGVEYQEVFDRSLFSGTTIIAGLTFYLRNFDNTNPITGAPLVANAIYPANYTIRLATVSIPVDGLDTTVENNIDPATTKTFFVGYLFQSVNDSFTITTTPGNYFTYNPAMGNLLLDISNDGTDPFTQTVYLDVNSSSGGLFSSAFDSNPHPTGCPDGSIGLTTGCANTDYGLVVGFDTPSGFVPEPSTTGLMFSGLGLLWRQFSRKKQKKTAAD